jgi:hypothetical protein
MSVRSLAVSKPNPLNARQEAFARNIAEGRCQREAYRRAGYTPGTDSVADVNASRLLRHDKVQSRVRELQAAQAQASQITAERVLAELEEARNLALSLGQAGAAVAASMGRAKLCGLLVDRREDVTCRPSRDPDPPAEVAVEVWLREVAPPAGD